MMASFKKIADGRWRAQVCCRKVRKSRTFFSKAAARSWAVEFEAAILDGSHESGFLASKTFGDLLIEYEDRVSAKKKGWKKESIRIKKFLRDDPICKITLADLSTNDFAKWRDARLKQVAGSSVNRELNLLSNALNVATKEWRWLPNNPMRGLKRPRESQHRSRLISDDEITRICFACAYEIGATNRIDSIQSRVAIAFLFAIETAMRAGEILNLTWSNINEQKRTCFLPDTKTGVPREVPLSQRAIDLLNELPKSKKQCFNLSSAQLDANFRKAKARACIDDLHFHDTRHEAITRLAKKVEVLSLARIVGIRDLKILMVYYNETAEDIAKRL